MHHYPKRISQTCLILAAILLAACSSGPPKPNVDYNRDYDFSKIKRIAFMPISGTTAGDSPRAMLSDMQINRINNALANAVELKGYEFVQDADQADALMGWHLFAEEKTDIRTTPTSPVMMGGYYGYGPYRGYNRAAYYNCWNCGSEVTVRQYTQGTFIVDIIDPKLQQSVWRSVIQSRLKKDLAQQQEPYNEAAINIMAGFPPP